MKKTTGVFIYGSCVSRDSYQYLDPSEFPLIEYVARQSLISSFSSPSTFVSMPEVTGLTSSFQIRMLRGDLNSSLPRLIKANAQDIDIILCDFVDERGGIITDNKGGFVTKSLAFDESGITDRFTGSTREIKFGTDEHFELWRRSFDAFITLLSEHNLLDKLVVLDHRWASETIQGDIFPLPGSQMLPTVINSRFRRYYTHVGSCTEFATITVPDIFCIGTRDHKWGPAPFHFHDSFYKYVVSAVKDIANDKR